MSKLMRLFHLTLMRVLRVEIADIYPGNTHYYYLASLVISSIPLPLQLPYYFCDLAVRKWFTDS